MESLGGDLTSNNQIKQKDSRSNGRIPKLQHVRDLITDASEREARDVRSEVDFTFLQPPDPKWYISEVSMINNRTKEEQYREKRSDMRSEMDLFAKRQSDRRDLHEITAFTHVKEIDQTAKDGLAVDNSHSHLGQSSMGVHLCRHADVQLNKVYSKNKSVRKIRLVVCKALLGRTKGVIVDMKLTKSLEPTPNYNSHVSLTPARPTDSPKDMYVRSQVYLYEYTDEGLPSLNPRNCLPYAIVTFRQRSQPSPCKRQRGVHQRTQQRSLEPKQKPASKKKIKRLRTKRKNKFNKTKKRPDQEKVSKHRWTKNTRKEKGSNMVQLPRNDYKDDLLEFQRLMNSKSVVQTDITKEKQEPRKTSSTVIPNMNQQSLWLGEAAKIWNSQHKPQQENEETQGSQAICATSFEPTDTIDEKTFSLELSEHCDKHLLIDLGESGSYVSEDRCFSSPEELDDSSFESVKLHISTSDEVLEHFEDKPYNINESLLYSKQDDFYWIGDSNTRSEGCQILKDNVQSETKSESLHDKPSPTEHTSSDLVQTKNTPFSNNIKERPNITLKLAPNALNIEGCSETSDNHKKSESSMMDNVQLDHGVKYHDEDEDDDDDDDVLDGKESLLKTQDVEYNKEMADSTEQILLSDNDMIKAYPEVSNFSDNCSNDSSSTSLSDGAFSTDSNSSVTYYMQETEDSSTYIPTQHVPVTPNANVCMNEHDLDIGLSLSAESYHIASDDQALCSVIPANHLLEPNLDCENGIFLELYGQQCTVSTSESIEYTELDILAEPTEVHISACCSEQWKPSTPETSSKGSMSFHDTNTKGNPNAPQQFYPAKTRTANQLPVNQRYDLDDATAWNTYPLGDGVHSSTSCSSESLVSSSESSHQLMSSRDNGSNRVKQIKRIRPTQMDSSDATGCKMAKMDDLEQSDCDVKVTSTTALEAKDSRIICLTGRFEQTQTYARIMNATKHDPLHSNITMASSTDHADQNDESCTRSQPSSREAKSKPLFRPWV